MRHAKLLQATAQAPESLERFLSTVKLAITLLTDLLRPSTDPMDSPIMVLGHHYISSRQLPGKTYTTA
jgi:hypothetical protein